MAGMKQAPADPGGCLEHGGECLVGFLGNWALEKELTSLITAGLSELDDDLPATPPDRQGQQQRMRASQSNQGEFQTFEPQVRKPLHENSLFIKQAH